MAELVKVDTLQAALQRCSMVGMPHAWLDAKLGLVVGQFPTASSRFDFGVENFLDVEAPEIKNKQRISLLASAKRVGQTYELETRDKVFLCGSATQSLIEGLSIIESLVPGTLEKLSKRKRRSKRIVARVRDDLYDIPHDAAHYHQLGSGYWVATNNKAAEAKGFLKQAVEEAGLTWGQDFNLRAVPLA